MPCTFTPTDDELRRDFNERALFDSPASVLLCEATRLLEKHGLLSVCSKKLQRWHKKHEKQDAAKLREMMAKHKTEKARKKALSKLSKRERKLLDL